MYKMTLRPCDAREGGSVGVVGVQVVDGDVEVVGPGVNRIDAGADIEGVKTLEASEGNGNELVPAVFRALLWPLNFCPSSPLLSSRSRCFRVEYAGQASSEH